MASARRQTGGVINTRVALRELPGGHLLAGLDGNANALILQTDLLDRIALCQLSGDLTQTAYALLADLVTVSRRAATAETPKKDRKRR